MRFKSTLAAIVALCAAFAAPSIAGAEPPYDPDTHESDVSLPDVPPVPCDYQSWSSPPKVVVHTGEFDGSALRRSKMIAAIARVNEQLGLSGGTSARVTSTEVSTQPFTLNTTFDASIPTIHVGFVSSLTDPDAIAATKPFKFVDSCRLARVNIGVLDLANWAWRFDTPSATGENYWEAQKRDAGGNTYFRISYQHELLHAFDLDHQDDEFSFLNYGNRPWANRHADDQIRPLPFDVGQLRERYPASDDRTEVAALTTWIDEDAAPSNGAAPQKTLCAPSRGSDFGGRHDAHCGTGGGASGSTDVCEGNTLRTRFALANYSTTPVDTVAQLWFSRDAEWEETDIDSVSSHNLRLDEAESATRGHTWTVPELDAAPGTDYYTILRVVAVPDGDDATVPVTTDWIPLPGRVQAC